MKSHILVSLLISLVLTTLAFAGKPIELRMKDGTRWRGEVGQSVEVVFRQSGVDVPMTGVLVKADESFITVRGSIAGVEREKVIFKTDLVSMKSVGGTASSQDESGSQQPASVSAADRSVGSNSNPNGSQNSAATEKPIGVIVMPMEGPVGETYRHEEVDKIGKKADEYGPGQIIVLIFNSGGGGVEMEKVHQSILEVRKRHRVIAWVQKAISAAAASASACGEIYFMPEGTFGAMTGYMGQTSLQGAQLAAWMDSAGKWFDSGGHNGGRYIAWAMIDDVAMLSYDKDPQTGEVTFYQDLSGKHVLSDAKENLVFTAETALHCGFSDGTAGTTDELAKLLNLPKWHELTDYGRRIAADWKRTCETAHREIPLLKERMGYAGRGQRDPQVVLGKRIQILQDLIRWVDRCPNVAEQHLPEKPVLERQLEEARKEMADMKRQR